MRQSASFSPPQSPSPPAPVLALCAHLESHGLPAALQGDGLLETVRRRRVTSLSSAAPAFSVVCGASAERIARALPRSVATAEHGSRLTQASEAGPIDVVCVGTPELDGVLERFALGPLALAHRPAQDRWIDPADQLAALEAGRLSLATDEDAFSAAPRRYWIAARLIAEYDLTPDDALVEAARKRFGDVVLRLPHGAPARREMARILAAHDPGPALAFLERVGVTSEVAAGAQPIHAGRIARLAPIASIRWAAWLRGSATTRAMVTFRMPHALARRIERVQSSHALDRVASGAGESRLRKLLARLDADEIEALFAWRRIELEEHADRDAARVGLTRLDALAAQLDRARERAATTDRVRTLALDGAAVMARLGAGPGRHVGRALAHLAQIVADAPEANDRRRLETELDAWADAHSDEIERSARPEDESIG